MIKEIKLKRKYAKLITILNGCTTAYITDSTYYFYLIDDRKQFLFYIQDNGKIVFSGGYSNRTINFSDLVEVELGLTDKEVKKFILERYGKKY